MAGPLGPRFCSAAARALSCFPSKLCTQCRAQRCHALMDESVVAAAPSPCSLVVSIPRTQYPATVTAQLHPQLMIIWSFTGHTLVAAIGSRSSRLATRALAHRLVRYQDGEPHAGEEFIRGRPNPSVSFLLWRSVAPLPTPRNVFDEVERLPAPGRVQLQHAF